MGIVRNRLPRILIVDDSMEQQDMLTEMLIDKYEILSAFNGNQALRIARQNPPPELILMDVIMPAPDGLEVCRMLAEDERTRPIPVVLTTGMGGGRIGEKAVQAGAVSYLKKPFSLKELYTTLEQALRPAAVSQAG